MTNHDIGKGLCLAVGGTNARVAMCEGNEVTDFSVDPTPPEPEQLFAWMADKISSADEKGAEWAVIGLPGLVSAVDGKHAIGPMANVPGLADRSYILEDELARISPDLASKLASFPVKAVNDGLLAAFAAAEVFSKPDKPYKAVASFIIGTGVGGGLVRLQPNGIYRPSDNLFEIGHIPLEDDPDQTFETNISGPALRRRHGVSAEDMDSEHHAWREVGQRVGQMAMIIGLVSGADLIVTCGGVGSNAYKHYYPYAKQYLDKFKGSATGSHREATPVVIEVDPEDSQIFEIRGASAVMRYHLSQQA